MPAVVVEDITVLPRIPEPDPAVARQRRVRSVTSAPRGFEGEGFPVRRAFAGVDLADLDPFIHLDQMGEVEYAPGEPKGTPWHPHRGFETVTYMIDGVFEHADSNGGGGVITNGDTQWMTAGAGILHIEKPPEWLVVSGGLFHGLQLWVNLPADAEARSRRATRTSARARSPCVASPDGGALVRVIAGEVAGHAGPGLDVLADDDGPRNAQPRRAAVAAVAARLQRAGLRAGGAGEVGAEGEPIATGQLAVLGDGQCHHGRRVADQDSRSPNLDVILLGGRPIREPVAWMGPFVMNTREEVMQAVADYQAGRLARSRPCTTPRPRSSSPAKPPTRHRPASGLIASTLA